MTESVTPVGLVVSALAAYRLTRLVVDDEITRPIRDKVVETFGYPDESKVSYLVTCPHCTGMYASAGVVVADMMAPRLWRPVARALALAAVVSLAYERR